MEIILGDTAARLTVQVEAWLHDPIAVVTYQSTAIGGDPQEPAGVFEDVGDMVMRKTVAQIQIGQIIPFRQQVAGVCEE